MNNRLPTPRENPKAARNAWDDLRALVMLHGSFPAVCGSFLGTHPHTLAAWETGTFIAFYGTVRPKRRIRRGERALRALGERGVEYVEVRCVDVNPFHPIGIGADEIRFMDIFLLHCLLHDSPNDSPRQIAAISRNQHLAAERGRDPDLRLDRDGQPVAPSEWGAELLRECAPIAAALDGAHGGHAYRDVLSAAVDALGDTATLPSARVLREAEHDYGKSFPRFALDYSQRHRRALLDLPLDGAMAERYRQLAEESLGLQRKVEAADTVPFEIHRQRYLGQDLMSGRHFRAPT